MSVARMVKVVLCATVFAATLFLFYNRWQGPGSKSHHMEASAEIVEKEHWQQPHTTTSGDDADDNKLIASFGNEANNETDKPSAHLDIVEMHHRQQNSTNNSGADADTIIIKSITHFVDETRNNTDSRIEKNKMEGEEMDQDSSLKKSKLKVDVYGGSVSNGGGLHDRDLNSFSALLEQNFPELEVTNKAIGGSGPGPWINCGITPADIIISEFRINESSKQILQEWYSLAHNNSQHTVILDLWSWLNSPRPNQSPTIASFKEQEESFPDSNTTFSILSLEQKELDSWPNLVAKFFNYSDSEKPIPRKCFDSAWANNEAKKNDIEKCRRNHANEMQHGREPYHLYVYQELAKHLREKVLPHVSAKAKASNSRTTTVGTRHSRCIGGWGLAERQDAKDAFLRWNESIVTQQGYSVHNPFSQLTTKITLNTNLTSATLTLGCPPPFNQSMKVGYIAHSDHGESGVVSINGMNISTWLSLDKRPHVRIRQYAPVASVPVKVSILELQAGAFVEFTDIACYDSMNRE